MKFNNIIAHIFNFTFFLHVSCDKNFDTYQPGTPIRLSLFHLNIALSHFYFLTFCSNTKKFSLWYRINFKDLVPSVDSVNIMNEVNDFNLTMSGKSDIHDAQLEFLKEKKADNKEAISGAYNKASFFLAFITSVVGVLTFLLPTISEYHSELFLKVTILWFLVASSLLNILNAGLFIYIILNVKGYVRYKFTELSSSKGDNFELLYHYFEWKAGDKERVNIIGLLKNAIKFSMRAFCFSVLLWAFIQLFPAEKPISKGIFNIPIYFTAKNYEPLIFRGLFKNETVFIQL